MRLLLLLALLLYDLVDANRPSNYDYDDMDGMKRHSFIDDRRNWRKKALLKPIEMEKGWDGRRHDYDQQRGYDESEKMFGGIERQREMDMTSPYRGQRRYEDMDKMDPAQKSAEVGHGSPFVDKEGDKKLTQPAQMNCERQHERYEACFAGCAAVTCDNPRDRLRPCYPFCEPGCICTHPYVRDDRTHKCILPEECTKGLKGIPDLGEEV